jgi:hypothetical protein
MWFVVLFRLARPTDFRIHSCCDLSNNVYFPPSEQDGEFHSVVEVWGEGVKPLPWGQEVAAVDNRQ